MAGPILDPVVAKQQKIKNIKANLFILGWVISYIFLYVLMTGELGQSSTGETSSFFISMLVGVIVIVISVILIEIGFKEGNKKYWGMGYIHFFTFITFIAKIPAFFYWTTIRGFSLTHGSKSMGGFRALRKSLNEGGGNIYFVQNSLENLYAPFFALGTLIIIIYIARCIISHYGWKNLLKKFENWRKKKSAMKKNKK